MTAFPSVTFPSELPPVVRKELEHLVGQIEGFLRAAGFNADGSFHNLITNQITVLPNEELGGNGSATVQNANLCVENGELCIKNADGQVVFKITAEGRIFKWIGNYQQYVGSYTGTGVDGEAIAVPFTPDAVIAFARDGNVTVNFGGGCCKTSAMPNDGTAVLIGAAPNEITTGITALAASGFTLGTHESVNEAGTEYVFLAFKDSSGAMFKVGTYDGDDADDRSIEIDATGWRPTFLQIYSGGTGANSGGEIKHTEMAVDYSVSLNENSFTGNKVQKFEANGFQVGSDTGVNKSGTTYYWLAWRDDVADKLLEVFKRGSYSGTGSGQSITGVGFTPEMVRAVSPTAFGGNWRDTEHTSTNSSRTSSGLLDTTAITDITADGFDVGARQSVAAATHWWQAWKTGNVEGLIEVFDPAELYGALSVDGDTVSLAYGQIRNVHVAADAAIALSKLADIATNRILGRTTAGDGEIEQLQVGASLVLTAGTIVRAALSGGDVTASQNSNVLTIANNAVTYAKMQDVSAASRLLGRGSASGSGDPEELTVGSDLRISGTVLESSGRWEPVTDGDPTQPELVFSGGDVVMAFVPY